MRQNTTKKYTSIYFDLDNTLWDFKKNSEQTLLELMEEYFPEKVSLFSKFLSVYYPINEKMWVLYRKGLVTKETLRNKRFIDSFKQIGIFESEKAIQFGDDYIKNSPYQTGLFPYTHDILEYLSQKGYKLYLLTNGFREVQIIKISESRIEQFFDKMICSEDTGYQKPHRKMFEYALKSVNAKKNESIMIGDDLGTDIAGAKNMGLDCIFFNPDDKKHNVEVTYEIKSLNDLRSIL